MEWTTEQPTKDGLYWAFDGQTVSMADVLGAYVYGLGERYGSPVAHVNDYTHWMGPLESPAPPTPPKQEACIAAAHHN